MCPGLAQSTRGDILYMWIYIHQHIFISHTPQNWIYLRLPLLNCDSWHIGEEFFRPAQRHTWISEQRSVGSLEDEHPPPQYKRMKRENELGAISGVMYSKNHHAHTHTHTHTQSNITECQRRVSVSTSGWGKEITLPVAQILNEWKFDWNDFPIWADWRT